MSPKSRFWSAVGKRLWLVVIVVLVFLSGGFVFDHHYSKTKYEADTSILVNIRPGNSQTIYDEQSLLQASQQLLSTYITLLQSNAVEGMAFSMISPSVYQGADVSVKLSNPDHAQIINISVVSSKPGFPEIFSRALITAFRKETESIVGVNSIQVMDPPHSIVISPDRKLEYALALVVGVICGMLLAFILELTGSRIRTERDAERATGLSILGTITKY